jgi:hypothetical protein
MKYAPGLRVLYGRDIQNWGSFVKGLSASFPRFSKNISCKSKEDPTIKGLDKP